MQRDNLRGPRLEHLVHVFIGFFWVDVPQRLRLRLGHIYIEIRAMIELVKRGHEQQGFILKPPLLNYAQHVNHVVLRCSSIAS